MELKGKRNLLISVGYLASCCFVAWLNPDQIAQMGQVFGGMGFGVGVAIFGRGYNKAQEVKNGGLE